MKKRLLYVVGLSLLVSSAQAAKIETKYFGKPEMLLCELILSSPSRKSPVVVELSADLDSNTSVMEFAELVKDAALKNGDKDFNVTYPSAIELTARITFEKPEDLRYLADAMRQGDSTSFFRKMNIRVEKQFGNEVSGPQMTMPEIRSYAEAFIQHFYRTLSVRETITMLDEIEKSLQSDAFLDTPKKALKKMSKREDMGRRVADFFEMLETKGMFSIVIESARELKITANRKTIEDQFRDFLARRYSFLRESELEEARKFLFEDILADPLFQKDTFVYLSKLEQYQKNLPVREVDKKHIALNYLLELEQQGWLTSFAKLVRKAGFDAKPGAVLYSIHFPF